MRGIYLSTVTVILAVLLSMPMIAQTPETAKKTNGGIVMKHELPPLPYDYDALEPYYDEATVRIHHDKHHAAYVAGLNKAEEKLADACESGDFALVQHWERQLAFHGGGHILHSIFWENMAPNAGGEPHGELANQINKDFGSFENFQSLFSAAATSVEANGWAVMAWHPEFKRLYVMAIENHQKQIIPDTQIVLVLDMWEHAYYLKHQNQKANWVENWWHIVNWQDVSKRFAETMRTRETSTVR